MSKYTDEKERYLNLTECLEILSVEKNRFEKILKNVDIPVKNFEDNPEYSEKAILEFKAERDKFWEEHLLATKAYEEYSKALCVQLNPIKVPSPFLIKKNATAGKAYSIKELDNLVIYYKNNYITYAEATEILNLSEEGFFKAISKCKVRTLRANRAISDNSFRALYSKEDILSIQKGQEEFLKDCLLFREVVDIYGATVAEKCKAYPAPDEFRRTDIFSTNSHYYKKSEVEEYMNLRRKKENSTSIELETALKTCLARLELRCEHHSFGNRPYTETKLISFVDQRLTAAVNRNTNVKHINTTINLHADIIGHILKFLNDNSKTREENREIYSLSTPECQLLIYTMQNKYAQEIIYKFLMEVQQDIVLSRKSIDSNSTIKKGFNLQNIPKPNRKNEKKKRSTDVNKMADEVYTFETYLGLFEFTTNAAIHLENFYKLTDENKKFRFLSIWLYLILQLTNAWRSIDIKDFPRLQIDDILEKNNITDVSWFKTNSIDLPSSRQIVTKVLRHKFLISKTGEQNNFYSSDNVSQIFATAVILLELCHKKSSIVLANYDEPVMYFNVKYNHPRDRMINSFLKELIKINPNFQYSNSIMTNTILSFSQVIAPTEFGIFVAKNERAHLSLSSTLNYVKFPKKQIDFLSEQLFERGEFGFIYDALIDIIYGNKDKASLLKERTDMIVAIKNTFGNVNKIEETLKLTNYYDQLDIIDILFKEGIHGCTKILRAINTNLLQSQEPHIQCLCSESGCLEPERHPLPEKPGCIGCKYSIKNVYTLSVLGERIKADCEEYLSSKNKIRKRKLSMRFFKYKEIVLEAIKKFGKEYTYSSLGIDLSREDFANYIRQIEKPSDVLKSDLELLLERK